jgi:uncharacterized protein (DUF302 family)
MATLTAFTFGTRLAGSPAEIRPKVEAALKAEGFGILTEIDFQATMKNKLGVDRQAYLILGACNPSLANRAVSANPAVGALLPCNVVLRADGDDTVVEMMDPLAVMELVRDPEVSAVAEDAASRLSRAVLSLESGS